MRTPHVLLAAGTALALTLSACGDNTSTSASNAGGSTTTAAGAAATGGAACAKADGSSPKTQQFSAAPPMCLQAGKKYTATIVTTAGTMTAELYAADAPRTVNNFVTLARDGFYDGVIFHRVIPGFMIQGGDPDGTGRGGPGYKFNDEPVKRRYTRGTLAMANAGPNTNGSQFFIMHADYGLPPSYTIFGKLTSGEDIVDAIASTPRDSSDRPRSQVSMTSVTITES